MKSRLTISTFGFKALRLAFMLPTLSCQTGVPNFATWGTGLLFLFLLVPSFLSRDNVGLGQLARYLVSAPLSLALLIIAMLTNNALVYSFLCEDRQSV